MQSFKEDFWIAVFQRLALLVTIIAFIALCVAVFSFIWTPSWYWIKVFITAFIAMQLGIHFYED